MLGKVSPQAAARFPYYMAIPEHQRNDPVAMLKWKTYVRERCIHDLEFRANIDYMCSKDAAFFIATFAWLVEPRGSSVREIPFTPWPDQIDIIGWWDECFGKRSMANEKTRGIGASVVYTWYHIWKWRYSPKVSIAALSKDEDTLEAPTAQSMLGRFVWFLRKLPAWMQRDADGPFLVRDKKFRIYTNRKNGAAIQGFVSSGQKLRGNRFTVIWCDEFAFFPPHIQAEWMTAASGTTDSMLFVSTWNDFSDTFHHICHEDESSMLVVFSFWQNNVERAKGMYRMQYGSPVLIDTNYQHEDGYAFGEPDVIEQGLVRSPWVDSELSKPNTDTLKALRDLYGMAVCEQENNFFPRQVRDAVAASLQRPSMEGLIDTTGEKFNITPTFKGDIKVWGDVPNVDRGPYTMGCDLSQGVGKAFSAAVVLDAAGRQVVEYGTRELSEPDFAANCVAIARWLAGDNGDGYVKIDFESNGQQSKPFSGELLRLKYGNIASTAIKGRKKTVLGEIPTYLGTTNRDGGYNNLKEVSRAILAMQCTVRSGQISEEMRLFSKDPDKDNQPRFPRNNKLGHGDYTQALGVAWFRARSTVDVENDPDLESDGQLPKATIFEPRTKKLWSNRWRLTR
jgi:hypothetical protein